MKELIIRVEDHSVRSVTNAIRKIKGVKAIRSKEFMPDDPEFWIRPDSRKPTKEESEKEAKRCDESPMMSLAASKRWFEKKTGKKV